MRQIHPDEMLGLIHANGVWSTVFGVAAEFILDYPKYDPSYFPGRGGVTFRDGLDVVTPQDGDRYLKALSAGVVPREELAALVEGYGSERTRPVVLIDFDGALFVSSFFDQAFEEEAGLGWNSRYGDPMAFAPPDLQEVWPPFNE